jgi:hypothetical protein
LVTRNLFFWSSISPGDVSMHLLSLLRQSAIYVIYAITWPRSSMKRFLMLLLLVGVLSYSIKM